MCNLNISQPYRPPRPVKGIALVLLREIKWIGKNWIDLTQDRDWWRTLLYMVTNLRVQCNAAKFVSSYTTGGFSRKAQLHAVGYI
jgi:hypothetical protein